MRNLALENRRAKRLATRSDLENAWRETASRHDFGPNEALQLLDGDSPANTHRAVEDRIEERLTERHAIFEARELRTPSRWSRPPES